jgi:hypothetical protein
MHQIAPFRSERQMSIESKGPQRFSLDLHQPVKPSVLGHWKHPSSSIRDLTRSVTVEATRKGIPYVTKRFMSHIPA